MEVSDSAISSLGHPTTSTLLACHLLRKKDSGVLPGKKSDILEGGADDSATLCLGFLETTCIEGITGRLTVVRYSGSYCAARRGMG
jgi:hypothetical protein